MTAEVFVYEQGTDQGIQTSFVPICLACRTGLGAFNDDAQIAKAADDHTRAAHEEPAERLDGTIEDLDAILNGTPAASRKAYAKVRAAKPKAARKAPAKKSTKARKAAKKG